MKLTKMMIATVVAQMAVSGALAQNRGEADDRVFNRPTQAGGTQWLLGIAEVIGANYAYPGLPQEGQAVRDAEKKLKYIQDLPSNEAQRRTLLKTLSERAAHLDGSDQEQLLDRIDRIKTAPITSPSQKRAMLSSAEEAVTVARTRAIRAAQQLGLVGKAVRIVRIGTSIALVSDVAARIYIWNALEADPTLTPAGTYLSNLIESK